jgi:hypothetical protein
VGDADDDDDEKDPWIFFSAVDGGAVIVVVVVVVVVVAFVEKTVFFGGGSEARARVQLETKDIKFESIPTLSSLSVSSTQAVTRIIKRLTNEVIFLAVVVAFLLFCKVAILRSGLSPSSHRWKLSARPSSGSWFEGSPILYSLHEFPVPVHERVSTRRADGLSVWVDRDAGDLKKYVKIRLLIQI